MTILMKDLDAPSEKVYMKIKNWEEFQHFKDRTPPWIKLYRYLLDDPEWHKLSGDDAEVLTMLWLVASEDKAMQGNLPKAETLAFRLRIAETKLNQSLSKLKHWVILDDIKAISGSYQDDAPETETETEAETYSCAKEFENFWLRYPKKVGKHLARKSWITHKPRLDNVLETLSWQLESEQWNKENGKYIPNPATYINQGRWLDEKPLERSAF